MQKFSWLVIASLLAVPALAEKNDEKKKRIAFKIMLDVPVESSASTDYDPASYLWSYSPERGFEDFLEDFIIDTYVHKPGYSHVQPPYILDWGDGLGTASGWGHRPRYAAGDDVYLGSFQWAYRRQTGFPLGLALDFRPKGRTWVSLGWQKSATTVIEQNWRSDFLHVENIDRWCCSLFVPALHWRYDLSRHRNSGRQTFRLTNHYITAAFKYDLFPDLAHASVMPTAGGRLWLLRESVNRETWQQDFEGSFFPERRDQSAEDSLGRRRKVKRDEWTDWQEKVQWFAGVNGEVYPWGKDAVFGVGIRAIYVFNNGDVESPSQRYMFRTKGWNVSAQAILAF